MRVLEVVVAGLFLLTAVRVGVRTLRDTPASETGKERALVALHDAARIGFWVALGGFFLGYGLLDEPQGFRWFAMVPIGMAGLRLAAAALLSRT